MFANKKNKTIKPDREDKRKKGLLSFSVRHSVRAQFTIAFLTVMLATIILFLVFNECFLENFYIRDKEHALKETYEQINEAANDDDLTSDSLDVALRKTAGPDNIGVVVLNSESVTVMSYSTDSRIMIKRLYDNMFGLDQVISSEDADRFAAGDETEEEIQTEDTESLPAGQDTDDSFSSGTSGTAPAASPDADFIFPTDFKTYRLNIISSSGSCIMQEVFDTSTASRYMEMWGTLDNGYYFLLRTPLESIKDSKRITIRFYLITALFATIFGIILALILGNRITKPIRELTAVSERMKHLDFSAEYTGRSKTEIGELGRNFNDMSRTLEQTISELKTANAELQQDIQKREEIDAMRKEFLSNVTHELKTPIALIQGYAEGLQDCVNDDPESRDFYADVIVDEAGKMNTMVQKLLSLNHLEFGQETVNMEHFDVCDLIGRYLQTAHKLADEKQAEIRIDPAAGTENIEVWSDSFLVEEVFTNYYSNACNHVETAPDGSKLINIRIIRNENDDKVRISVFNTGKPIPEESVSRIWEKFYKVDKARTRAYGGSGIGLSIVKAIMELLGEKYGVINYDNGVEFYFELDTRSR